MQLSRITLKCQPSVVLQWITFNKARELTDVSHSVLSLLSPWRQQERKKASNALQWSEEQNGSDSGTFPPLRRSRCLLTFSFWKCCCCTCFCVITKGLSWIWFICLAVLCVWIFAIIPATGGSGAATPTWEGSFGCYLQLLASRQTFFSVGKPACQRANLLCLAGQSRHSAKRWGGRRKQQSAGCGQTSCYSPWLGPNMTVESNQLRQQASKNNPGDNGCRLSYLKELSTVSLNSAAAIRLGVRKPE